MIGSNGQDIATLSFRSDYEASAYPQLELKSFDSSGRNLMKAIISPLGIYFSGGNGATYARITATGANFPGLSTIDPHISGQLWRDGTNVKVSLG